VFSLVLATVSASRRMARTLPQACPEVKRMEIYRICELCEDPLGPDESSVCVDKAACAERQIRRHTASSDQSGERAGGRSQRRS
jgi:hypothetical protein